jgi:hypothetical protein
MKYCRKCLQPDSRPGTEFVNGVCPACEFRLTSTKSDWQNRKRILKQVVDARKSVGHVSGHDSILGVSGGKDSTRLALFARDALGLNPLLVSVTYPPLQMTKVGANNLDNLEWATCLENNLHKIKNGLSNTTKKVIQYDINMNKLNEFYSIVDASNQLNLHISTISNCCSEKTKFTRKNKYIFRFG